jgi:hypothetical protein
MTSEITRVTMIKIPSETHQSLALQGFETFTKNQKRVFKCQSVVFKIPEADEFSAG